MELSSFDRVIINGGEPFLHSQIIEILKYLKSISCEVLIYTNGTLINRYDLKFLTSNFRFVIPIHGYSELHDKIIRHKGGFEEMSKGITELQKYNCLVDIKLILNDGMTNNCESFVKTLNETDNLYFNHAIHIQKMADTFLSKKNHCPSVSMNRASVFTKTAFDYFKNSGLAIKLFDTCIRDISIDNYSAQHPNIQVYFKDFNREVEYSLKKTNLPCQKHCINSDKCFSAVDSYMVLEYHNGLFYKSIE